MEANSQKRKPGRPRKNPVEVTVEVSEDELQASVVTPIGSASLEIEDAEIVPEKEPDTVKTNKRNLVIKSVCEYPGGDEYKFSLVIPNALGAVTGTWLSDRKNLRNLLVDALRGKFGGRVEIQK